MKRIHKIILLLFSVLLVVACSRKKNTFLSRNFHAVTAEYNALYNGGVAMDAGKQELANSYRDNFWEILPVERVKIDEDNIKLPGQAGNPNFEKAEEKAAKAIQKHSIFIDGKEYNPQIDEAYMLLGRARYMEGRFLPALDAFNYILYRYPTSNNINFAKVWKAKANIRLENEEVALEDLEEMLDKGNLDDKELADATAIMAQAYINLDSLPEAIPYIKLASEYEKDNELKGRYAYIKGQLYNRVGHKDSANMAFDEVIELNRKSPRVYMINAYIAKANNFDYESGDRTAFLELLRELEENRENRPYLDKIYNQIGEYYRNVEDIDSAVMFYNKSIQAYNQDRVLQAKNYTTLAEINFDAAYYQAAGSYYDSTLTFLEPISREYRRVTKKRENLDDVIKYEDIAMRHDSIIELASLSEAEQLAYFSEYTQKLKDQAIQDSIAASKVQEQMANAEFFPSNSGRNSGPKPEGGQFYFYNPTIAAYGKQEFKKIWGNRELRDYWRLSSIQTSNIDEEEIVEGESISDNAMFDPQTYISQLPTEQKVIDSLIKDRDFAYYQLGLIYKEKFREYNLATNRLEKLLTFNPEERLTLPAKYNLYKIYDLQGDAANAEKWRNDIITNHSDSRYAEILRNPNKALELDESSPEYKYKQLYNEFENSRYEYVIETANDYINQYTGTEIVPKLEMLKATAIGRQQGYEAYKEALNYVSLNYPTSEEGKEAQKMYSTVLPKLASTAFVAAEEDTKWKVVYQFTAEEREKAEELKVKLDDALTNYRYVNMSSSIDYYNPNTIFVILHGFNTEQGGKSFAQILKENKDYKIEKASFTITTPNYKTVQIHKNLDAYLNAGPITEENKEEDPQK